MNLVTIRTEEQERDEFERWAETEGALPWMSLKKRRTGNGYSAQVYNYMWNAWKARADLPEVKNG